MEWRPPRGFFESSSAMLSPDIAELSFDGVVSRVLAFLPKVV
jgi:hypothetical protein